MPFSRLICYMGVARLNPLVLASPKSRLDNLGGVDPSFQPYALLCLDCISEPQQIPELDGWMAGASPQTCFHIPLASLDTVEVPLSERSPARCLSPICPLRLRHHLWLGGVTLMCIKPKKRSRGEESRGSRGGQEGRVQ